MKQIRLKKLTLTNFKGVRSFSAEFSENTCIRGDNATGKTTLFDAFTWLLFGKDSEDRKDFNIKTLDKNNNVLHKLDHEVEAILDVDGSELRLKRVFREKWVKKRGEEKPEFTGHETTFFFNDVPMQQKEFGQKVDGIISEQQAKLLTNPLYFNGLKWQDRRAVLFQIAGGLSDSEVAQGDTEFEELLAALSGKTLDEYKREISAKKKKLADELEAIPTRIDEANRSMPEVPNYSEVEAQIEAKNKELRLIEEELEDGTAEQRAKLEEIKQKQQEKHELSLELSRLEQSRASIKKGNLEELKREKQQVESEGSSLKKQLEKNENDIEFNNRSISGNNNHINRIEKEVEEIRSKWRAENAKELSIAPDALCCPTCKREYEPGTVEEMKQNETANFNAAKARTLESFEKQAKEKKEQVESLKKENKRLEEQNDSIREASKELREKLTPIADKISELMNKIREEEAAPGEEPSEQEKSLKAKIEGFVIPSAPESNTEELKAKKRAVVEQIDALKKKLSVKEQVERLNNRISELEEQEKKLAQEIASLEKIDFTISRFTRAKIDALEEKVNSRFKLVKFKMFEQQINGGETEACECLVNGVPYSDVNTAGKINAGLDVLNVLSEHYGISAPVWIDNRESINELLPCSSQLISLAVSQDKKLFIINN